MPIFCRREETRSRRWRKILVHPETGICTLLEGQLTEHLKTLLDHLLVITTSPKSWIRLGTQVESESKLKKCEAIHKHINTENSLEIKQLNTFVTKVAP